jgi:hypothetical protein
VKETGSASDARVCANFLLLYFNPPTGSGDKDSKVMNDDKFNMSMRKFLKQVGVTSQRAIESLVREQKLDKGKITVRMVLTAPGTSLNHVVEEDLDLG